jgi:hypothetical protein
MLGPSASNQFLITKKIGGNYSAFWRKIDAEDLGTGAVGSGNKYLADDMTWKTVSSGLSSITFTSPLTGGTITTTGTVGITQSGILTDGYLSSIDWNTFNNKQSQITLTTTGSSGSASFISNTLNVPTYTLAGLGGVPTSRTLTINGTAFDLSADRSWTLATGLTNWTEAFSSATQATSSLTATNAATNVNAAIVPKGNGAIVAAIPDGTSVGGNARGVYAVDLQMLRTNANQVASSNYSFLGNGLYNQVAGDVSVIAGGQSNTISGSGNGRHVIVGGSGNSINSGQQPHFIGGGASNSLSFGSYSVVVGGQSNSAAQTHVFMGGGQSNSGGSAGSYTVVVGGQSNTTSASYATIVGGQSNTASGIWSFIGGGKLNTSAGYYNVIGGGFTNSGTANSAATTQITTIARTANTTLFLSSANANIRVGQYITGSGISADTYATSTVTTATAVMNTSTISGTTLTVGSLGSGTIAAGMVLTGTGVTAGTYIVSGSGLSWTVSVSQTVASTTITGTSYTITISQAATTAAAITLSFFIPHGVVVGGGNNQATGLYSFIGGGGDAGTAANRNIASGDWSVVVGGRTNSVSGEYSAVGGGISNSVAAKRSVIAGGNSNSCPSGSQFYCFIGAGSGNIVNNDYGVVCGGAGNRSGQGPGFTHGLSFVGAGESNYVYTDRAGIVSGLTNLVQASYGFIGAGRNNNVNAIYSSISGGFHGLTDLYGQTAHASGQFSGTGDAQAHELIWRRAVTGTAITELFLDGASIAAILRATNCVWHGILDVVAICTVAGTGTTVVGHVAATSYKVTIKRIGTTTSLVGGVQEIGITNADASMSTAVFTIDNNDTNESLRVRFTPPSTAGSTTVIRAVATFRGTQIQY